MAGLPCIQIYSFLNPYNNESKNFFRILHWFSWTKDKKLEGMQKNWGFHQSHCIVIQPNGVLNRVKTVAMKGTPDESLMDEMKVRGTLTFLQRW